MTTVVIPFRSDDPERVRIFDWCLERWEALHPELEVIVSGDGNADGPFCRARAVNRGVARTLTATVIVADADTAVRHGQTDQILDLLDYSPWVVGYSRFVHLAAATTDEAVACSPAITMPVNPIGPTVRWHSWESVCGLIAFRRDDFETIGGFDERFVAWGHEDTAFAMTADTLIGHRQRVPGVGIHLFHTLRPDRKTDIHARANFELGLRYEKANGHPDAMTALVREALAER